MAEDVNFLYDMFNLYYNGAKKAQADGNVALAKRNFLLAAQTLMKVAANSSQQLKKAQFERAKRLVDIADSLREDNVHTLTESKPAESGKSKAAEAEDKDLKKWQGAEIPTVRFSDVAGLENVKAAITAKMINPFRYPDKYARYGVDSGGGVLLYGPPGTGKTMIARAIACEVGAKLYLVKCSDIVSKWVGDSEKNISALFECAREDKLAIIFIDEMDSLFASRDNSDTHNNNRVNELLQQIDGFSGSAHNILLLGATNRPWDVDSAATRAKRFTQKIYVTLPDQKAREFLFRQNLKNAPLAAEVSIEKLAEVAKGYSGADIFAVCDRAKIDPLTRYIENDVLAEITNRDFALAFKLIPPTVTAKEVKRFDDYARKNGGELFLTDEDE